MGFVIAKALVPFLLSLLCFTVFSEKAESLPAEAPHHRGSYHHYPTAAPVSAPPSHAPSQAPTPHHHHHHGHAPAPAPVHTPAHAPVHPPKPHMPPPVPTHFPRKLVAVQGVVYCKSCNYSGVDTLLGAKPVLGATVKLQCNNTMKPQDLKTTTDKNGYFLIKAPGTITNYGVHKCKVWLVSSPSTACSKITNLHGGLTGAMLRPEKKPFVDEKKREFALFSVGPFAFESKCPR
ncbi:non-classical arabinogalactan protein 30-like [Populus nigra]|uniref:non-classical arabinogalactan protein 30-like n=1 Tax=Populus nigra TaxID=3691 RepID=UPI002B276797|nr:non-classical arabinogalactan protein 30-like [Populus nigra]